MTRSSLPHDSHSAKRDSGWRNRISTRLATPLVDRLAGAVAARLPSAPCDNRVDHRDEPDLADELARVRSELALLEARQDSLASALAEHLSAQRT